ncbi:uncharacterized protein LOC120336129 [Styela clava]|uniref:uncharacterized protein LOC120336129 n=1 Tax=Styela clava TaxID=7725 RepID=UPI00193AC8CB|nr:uncharacterized protein LOC120336129 [Styela clava]
MYRLGVVVAFLYIAGLATAQLPPPEKLVAFSEYDGALIRFEPVEGAIGYLGVLGAEESSSVESPDPQLYFGNLEALTEYTVFVSAIDEDGNEGEPSFYVFTTGVGEITNFKVVTVSASLMTLEWDPMNGVESYIIDPIEDTSMPPIQLVNTSDTADIPSIPSVRMTGDASARLTGLRPMTYYKISIRGLQGTDLGPTSTIRARTDGQGLVLYNLWEDHNGVVIGGSGTIFKPLDHPDGPYSILVEFPCELEKLEVWEARLDNTTDLGPGIFNLLQDEIWMQNKNEVGFNFYTVYNETTFESDCDFDPKAIEVTYGSDAVPKEATFEFDIPYDISDWGGAGILTLKLDEIFRNPNQAAEEGDTREPKPDPSRMAIQIALGANCSALTMQDCWNIDRVYNATVDSGDDTYYFVQPQRIWWTNDIGIVISFNEALCPDPESLEVFVLSGGTLVDELHENYELQEVKDTCVDDPFEDEFV